MEAPASKRQVPWCMIFLVVTGLVFHAAVLWGNFQTAAMISHIGKSTNGWSGVGLQLSSSMRKDLDEIMTVLTNQIVGAINQTLQVQEQLNVAIGFAGYVTSRLTQTGQAPAALLLQVHTSAALGLRTTPLDTLPQLLDDALTTAVNYVLEKPLEMVKELFEKLKPAMLKVGEFIIKFGDKIQMVMEQFSTTVDRVQKLLDQSMKSMAQAPPGVVDQMVYNTFTLFDVSNTGQVTKQDLRDVAEMYSITALQDQGADALVETYDQDGDDELNKDEFRLFVNDDKLPQVMAVVLRQYAKSLSQIAGKINGSALRDEVAKSVVEYFGLVCAKNQTKVGWVSDALTNGSLPLQFTADVLVELALKEDDPNQMTTKPVGGIVIGRMMELRPDTVSEAFELLSNATYWDEEGFDPGDQGAVVERVMGWMAGESDDQQKQMMLRLQSMPAQLGEAARAHAATGARSVLALGPTVRKLVEQNLKAHTRERELRRSGALDLLLYSQSAHSYVELIGGAPCEDTESTGASRATKSGVPAKPETLKFAKWLANNASATAQGFQELSFNYTGESSSATDSFANQIKGMVNRIKGFIAMLETYSTPKGIAMLEQKILDFGDFAADELIELARPYVMPAINATAHQLEEGLQNAAVTAASQLAESIKTAVNQSTSSLATALKDSLVNKSLAAGMSPKEAVESIANATPCDLVDDLGEVITEEVDRQAAILQRTVDQIIASVLQEASSLMADQAMCDTKTIVAEQIAPFMKGGKQRFEAALRVALADHSSQEQRMDGDHALTEAELRLRQAHETIARISLPATDHVLAKTFASHAPLHNSSLEGGLRPAALQMRRTGRQAPPSSVWTETTQLLQSLTNLLPQATEALKQGRTQVLELVSNLDSLFDIFQSKGPPIFESAASMWSSIWLAYFVCLLPFSVSLLLYAFWANGFFGAEAAAGAVDIASEPPAAVAASPDEEKTFLARTWSRMEVCCRSAGYCCSKCRDCCSSCHDMHLGFWSLVILMEVFVLITFLITVVLSTIFAAKAFLAAGCAQLYILSDGALCGQALLMLRGFVETFLEFVSGQEVDSVTDYCNEQVLLTCQAMGPQMQTNSMLTIVFSFLSTLFSFNMIVESAIMHSVAVARRKAQRELEEAAEDQR